jgi:hypothetical protein
MHHLNLPNCIRLLAYFSYFLLGGFAGGEIGEYPEISEINPGQFKFGQILIEKEIREFSLPAICNQTSGLIEYALVHDQGKTHESLFRTPVSPKLIHATFLLLKEKPQHSFFKIMESGGTEIAQIPTMKIFVEWEQNGTSYKEEINTMIQNQSAERMLSQNAFVFTGSKVIEGVYLAEEDGSIVAVYHDSRSTLNSRDEESNSDDVWLPYLEKMPPKELPVTIRFQLPYAK